MPDPFEEKKAQLERRLREQPLAILVWGSGSGGGKHYEKRQKIRAEVGAHFTASAVRFSEELHDFTPGASAEDVGLPAQEEYQLATADVAVVLDTGDGPAAEIAYFARSPLKSKLIVFTHEKFKGSESFPARVREGIEHHFYTAAEYKSCSLVARVLDRLRYVALGKLLALGPV